ncbi:amidase [Fomitiporia mediterranea MF3/22]|uniref:amidase n=1 Tax=Fomitiporia mediterranea (strain MF3/22) TaxID=694068 RepID=UPI00044076B3|nr:amidase [Fomitiporia mediterranea MF3/22]EJD03787.1 amidase [Fomitiporia mediterranea MF3/22]
MTQTSASFASESGADSWQEISRCKRSDREAILNQYPQWRLQTIVSPGIKDVSKVLHKELSSAELEIVQGDASAILAAVHDRRYSCVQVIEAHCHAAVVAQDLTNCLTEIFFDEAVQRAKELDDYMDRTGEAYGPLHGLPVSIKDHIMVRGKDTSTGYVAWCYKTKADKDAVAVDILRKAGAILFVKTNNPQTLLSLETNNNIFGRTCNPYDRDRTPGGSSGGESALISLHGSPLGLGTDIGGSIRLPAACTGLYGFKASVARIPHKGLMGSHDGMDAIIGVLGPLTRSARDLSLFCRVMLEYKPWLVEPPLLEIPWRQDVVDGKDLPSRLCFAVLWDDKVFKPEPAIIDALDKCKTLLTKMGHVVIDWEPILHKEAWELLTKLYFLDGGEEYINVLKGSGEPAVLQTKWILDQVPNNGKPFTVAETFRLNLEREGFRQRLLEHWNNTEARTGLHRSVDAIIAPVAPTLAPRHGETKWWGYTSYWNLADYPAAVFPVGYCKSNSKEVDIRATLPDSQRNTTGKVDSDGLPVCLQLIGRRLNEERVLGMLNVIDDALGRDMSYSR